MLAVTFVVALLYSCSVLGFPSPIVGDVQHNNLLAGRQIYPTTFSGTVEGKPFAMNGTVSQVLEELHRLYPNNSAFDPAVLKARASETNYTALIETDMKARSHSVRNSGDDWNGEIYCAPVRGQDDWGLADKTMITDDVFYLSSLQSKGISCAVQGGPGFCVRISCRKGAAIFWCNDNAVRLQRSCTIPAIFAYQILEKCGVFSDGVAGQQFAKNRWNVIVRLDDTPNCR